jgi:hypothetical protein
MKMSRALVKHVRQALTDAGVKLDQATGASTSEPDAGGGQHAHSSSDDDDDDDEDASTRGIENATDSGFDHGGDDMDDFKIEPEWVGPEEQVSARI